MRYRFAALLIGVAALAPAPSTPSASSTAASIPAFPGAEGFGTRTPGGRGGRVIAVTNLRDDGPGSLRAALEAAGRRIVVFRVSGTIVLNDDIDIEDPFVTVLGQTAPAGGITLKGAYNRNDSGLMDIHTHDVVIRFLRFRAGTYKGPNESNPVTAWKQGTYNVVLDHNSFSWGVNENVTTYDYAHHITISWNIISEALRRARHPEGSHSRGLFMSGENNTRAQSAHHNLLAHNDERNPEINLTGTADFVNNVVYNWGEKAGLASDKNKGLPLNFVKNYYKAGPNSSDDYELDIYHRDDVCHGTLKIYLKGNIAPRRPNNSLPERRIVEPDSCVRFPSRRNPAPRVTTTSAHQAYQDVLSGAGAIVPHRDEVDRRIVREVQKGTGRIIDRPSQVGGWPTLPSGSAPADGDRDGMPDAWELSRGLNLGRDDSAGDPDGNGYSNIEDYANGLVAHLVPGTLTPSVSLPSTTRRARVRIEAINFDPQGRDRRRLNREWIRLENRGGRSIDVKGWVVRDRAGHRYRFTKRILAPGSVVTVRSGKGRDTARSRHWDRARPVWKNSGDRATLINRSGQVVDRCAYGRRAGRRAHC